MSELKTEILEFLKENGIEVKSKFVPFSQSRNKSEKHRSLNWVVTIKRNGREILETDFSAGMAHCPSYRHGDSVAGMLANHECETGRKSKVDWTGKPYSPQGAIIQPCPADVLHSLILDSDVLEYVSFEEWTENLGFDPDSRKAEKIYRDCIGIALRIRNGIPHEIFEALRVKFQDY